jgi:acetoin utilization deacetylase AcuC-like enzyme
MATLILTHPACLHHDTGGHHPERPARLTAVLQRLRRPDFADLAWAEAPRATFEQVERVHPRRYIESLLDSLPHDGEGLAALDGGDTVVSPGSREAILRAAGAACAAVDAVATGAATNAFCAVRPPGHHAEPEEAMGFCIVDNIAVAAQHARAVYGYKRIAIVDFDVHHGNGTQAAFARDPNVLFASAHQYPLYPGTGSRSERGVGNIVNAPLPAGAGSAEFRMAMNEHILPRVADFAPDFIMISAGFDGHADDPLASMMLFEPDYAWITAELVRIAAYACDGRVVSTLEGGYDLDALAESAAAHVAALMAA